MAMFCSDNSGGADFNHEDFAKFIGPGQIDQTIRQAIQHCWMMLPKEKKSVDEVEVQIRRVVDRALQNLREDAKAFGIAE
jgi:hypothetical protein